MLQQREWVRQQIEALGGLSVVISPDIQLGITYEVWDVLGRAMERLEKGIDRLENV